MKSTSVSTGTMISAALCVSSCMISVNGFVPTGGRQNAIGMTRPVLPSPLEVDNSNNNRLVPNNAFVRSTSSRQNNNRVVLQMTTDAEKAKTEKADSEIARLKAMAAKLRAEAATLEAEKAQELADAADKAFRKFDSNQDGEISLEELKAGLEKSFQLDLTEKRVRELMDAFDASGDGMLQRDEFVGVKEFKNKLEALAREEKELALKAQRDAKTEADVAKLEQARSELINEGPPTGFDRYVSVLPYLLPLLDGLQYGRFLLANDDGSNPFVVALAVLYTIYRSIPFSGFAAFFALNFLTGNLQLNRLVRFNLQQAIFVDIAMILPGLVFGVAGFGAGKLGWELPPSLTELSTDATFVVLLAILGYCTVSSLLGITPDKLPFISDSVKNRMPTIDMFDENGQFIGSPPKTDEEEEEKK